MFRPLFAYCTIIMLAVLLVVLKLEAQAAIILQAHVPTLLTSIPDDALEAFETEFGVEIIFHQDDTILYLPAPMNSLNDYLDALANYAQSADVLFVQDSTINPIGTKAGYLMNLAPLINADRTINPNDYAQAVWEAYQWDGGFWALPTSFDTVMMAYNPNAFTAANISIPNESWGFEDYAWAIEALTQRDANGLVTQAGYENGYDLYFFLSAPEDTQVQELWQNLVEAGSIGTMQGNVCCQVRTMSILPSSFLTNSNLATAALPNNVIGIDARGFAVSAGTAYPELAYELAKFLSRQEAIIQNTGQSYPAINSLQNIANLFNFPQAFLLNYAMSMDISLEMAQAQMQSAMLAAEERQNHPIGVTVPVGMGEGIRLRFGVQTYIVPMPNQALWDDAAMVFAAADDEVGSVIVEPDFSASLAETTQNYDCFIKQVNQIDALDNSRILPISPLLAQDASFDPNDLAGKLWDEMQATGEVYGYPLAILPRYLAVDSQVLAHAGLRISNDWSISEFSSVLQELNTTGYEIQDPFDLMMLLAAYGALPSNGDASFIESSAALAEVLRLRDAGLISYNGLLNRSGMGTPSHAPIRPASFNLNLGIDYTGFQLVNYPSGVDYQLSSYSLGVVYISRETLNPYACYRWLRYLSQRPDIFQGMPSHVSQMTEHSLEYNRLLKQPNLIVLPWIGMRGNNDSFVIQYFYSEAADNIFLNNAEIESALSAAQEKLDAYRNCRNSGQAPIDCAAGLLPVESVWN